MMRIEGKLRWRFSLGRWYLEDDRHGWAYLDHDRFGWTATAPQATRLFGACKAAKIWAERKVKSHVKPKKKSSPKESEEK